MFRHGNDLYLIARTDPHGQFWSKDNDILNILPDSLHHLIDLGRYSLRSHGTAIWRVKQEQVKLFIYRKNLCDIKLGYTLYTDIIYVF
jgi:hypothetical protein